MDIYFILAQIVGLCVILVNGIGDFQKNRKNIIVLNATANCLSALQYFLLGAYTGILCCLIAVLRNVVFSRYTKVPKHIFIGYIVIAILCNIYFVHNIIDLIPVINIIIFSYSLVNNDMKKLKIILIIVGLLGGIYDFAQKAFTSLIMNALDFTGGVVGTIQIRKEEKKLGVA